MTNHMAYKRTDKLFLARVPHLTANRAYCLDYWDGTRWVNRDFQERVGEYNVVCSLDDLPPHGELWSYTDRRNDVLGYLVNESAAHFDLLTEFAERKDTLSYLASRLKDVLRPMQAFKRARNRIRRMKRDPADIAEMVANLWLEYRYAIRPLVLSLKDALEHLERQDNAFVTSRSGDRSNIEFASEPEFGFFCRGVGQYHWRGTSKASYSPAAILGSWADGVGFDPLLTAWELVAVSFLVDFCLNIGTWLQSLSFNILDLAKSRTSCISIKADYTIDTYWRPDPADHGIPRLEIVSSPGGLQHVFEERKPPWKEFHMRSQVEDSYVREIVDLSEVELSSSFDLSSSQLLDIIALQVSKTNQAFRRLRK